MLVKYGGTAAATQPVGSELRQLAVNLGRHLRNAALPGTPRFPYRWDGENGLFWFRAGRVTLLCETYTPASIDLLVQQRGIHIGHTYLGLVAENPKDIAYRREGDSYVVRDEFQEFLDHVSAKIREGLLWNPTVREMTRYFEALSRVQLDAHADGKFVLWNHHERALSGVTLRSSRPLRSVEGPSPRERRDGDEHWYSVDLAGNSGLSFRV
jgi:hypothetical protein